MQATDERNLARSTGNQDSYPKHILKTISSHHKNDNQGWEDGSVVRALFAFPEDLSSGPGTCPSDRTLSLLLFSLNNLLSPAQPCPKL